MKRLTGTTCTDLFIHHSFSVLIIAPHSHDIIVLDAKCLYDVARQEVSIISLADHNYL